MYTFKTRKTTVNQLTIPKNHLVLWAGSIMLTVAFILVPELSEAATTTASSVRGDKELGAALANIKGLVGGTVGKIIATVSFAFGLMASIFKFNPAAIGGSFGVALTAGLGPQMIDTVVGATF